MCFPICPTFPGQHYLLQKARITAHTHKQGRVRVTAEAAVLVWAPEALCHFLDTLVTESRGGVGSPRASKPVSL